MVSSFQRNSGMKYRHGRDPQYGRDDRNGSLIGCKASIVAAMEGTKAIGLTTALASKPAVMRSVPSASDPRRERSHFGHLEATANPESRIPTLDGAAGPGDNPRGKTEGEPNSEPVAPIEEVENLLEVLAKALLEALRTDQELNDVFEPRRMIESFRNVLNAHGPFGFGAHEEEEAEEEEEKKVDQMDAENSAKN